MTRPTPATFAVVMLMSAEATRGYRPPGTYAPTVATGISFWPSRTPSCSSTSNSVRLARWRRANAAIWSRQ